MQNVKNTKHCDDISNVQAIPEYTLYKKILETSMDGFWMVDKNGNILEVNDAYCELSGYSRRELLSMNIADLEALESKTKIKNHLKYLHKYGSQKFITRHRCKNGKIIELEVSANSIKYDRISTFAFFRDITELKKHQDLLQRERDTAQKYLDISGVIFVALNNKGNITLMNKKGCEILGCKEEEVINRNWFDTFIPERIRKEVKKVFVKLINNQIESSNNFENPIVTKTGEEKIIAWHNTTIKDDNSKIAGTLSSGMDITERKEAEQKINNYQKQLKQMASAIEVIEEHERRRIAAGMHDDVGQRLAIIKFGLDTLQASETRSDILVSLRRQSKLISSAIEEVRSLTFELSNPILYEVGLEAAVETWMNDHINKKCGIDCEFKTMGPKINLIEEKRIILFHGVRELLTNTVKHAKANHVKVEIIRNKHNISTIVKDNGRGFDYNNQDIPQKEKKGFGLFNLREKLEFWGGCLEIQKASPNGTIAKINIPVENKEIAMETVS